MADPSIRDFGKSYFEIRIRFQKPRCVISTSLLTASHPGVLVEGGGQLVEMVTPLDAANGFTTRIAMELEARSLSDIPFERVHFNLLFWRLHTQHTFWIMPGCLPCRSLTTGSPEEEWVTDTFQTEGGTTVSVSLRLLPGDAWPAIRGVLPNEPAPVPDIAPSTAANEAPSSGGAADSGPATDDNGQKDCLACVVCCGEKKTVCLFPCKHLCVCAGCHNTLRRNATLLQPYLCPLCRRAVTVRNCVTSIFV